MRKTYQIPRVGSRVEDFLSVFPVSPEPGIANLLLRGGREVQRPAIGGAPLNGIIRALTGWDVVEDFGSNAAEDSGEVFVDFLLVGTHAFTDFVQ